MHVLQIFLIVGKTFHLFCNEGYLSSKWQHESLPNWFNMILLLLCFVDLFDKLVPLPVYEALTAFENRKSQIANAEIGRLREQTQLMNR